MPKLTELLEIVLNEIDFARESDNTIESITEADELARRLFLATI
jgi:hypothetical protein